LFLFGYWDMVPSVLLLCFSSGIFFAMTSNALSHLFHSGGPLKNLVASLRISSLSPSSWERNVSIFHLDVVHELMVVVSTNVTRSPIHHIVPQPPPFRFVFSRVKNNLSGRRLGIGDPPVADWTRISKALSTPPLSPESFMTPCIPGPEARNFSIFCFFSRGVKKGLFLLQCALTVYCNRCELSLFLSLPPFLY